MAAVQGRSEQTVQVVNAVRRILRALRVAAGATQAAGLSAAQVYVLEHLANDVALSINELAKETLTDRSSVASVVDRLVTRGLIERSTSARDRRRAEVRITEAGHEVLRKAPPAPTSLLVDALDDLSESELRTLARSMRRLVKAMGLEDTEAPMLFEDSSRASEQS